MVLKQKNIYKRSNGFFIKHITIALFIAMGATAFVSCSTSDEPIIEVPIESVAVQFNTSIEKETQTRATTLDDAALKSEGFGVLAYYTQNSAWSAAASTATPNFMHNQKISWSTANSLWNYSPIKYWSNNTNDKVSFFAYAPFETSPTNGASKGIRLPANTATGTPSINFSINSSIANQVDLVYASAKDKNREVVDFQFKHALSRIGFSAKTAAAYSEEIKVTNISVSGKVYPSATFTFSDQSNNGSWGSHATTVNAGITYAPNNIALTTTAQQINAANQYIMIIPQNFAGTNKVTIGTTYTVNGALPGITSSEDIDFNFEQGKAYNITLNISVDKITIDIVVAPWQFTKTTLFIGYGYNVEVDDAGNVTIKNMEQMCDPNYHKVTLRTINGVKFNDNTTEKLFTELGPNASSSYTLTNMSSLALGEPYLKVYYNIGAFFNPEDALVKTFIKE